ncbi:MAG: FliM/FliN family flagellar motor switch protein [bacterium]
MDGKLKLPAYKRVIRLTPSIGDWTTLRALKKDAELTRNTPFGFDRLTEDEITQSHTRHYAFGDLFSRDLKNILEIQTQYFASIAQQQSYGDFLEMTKGANFVQLELSSTSISAPIGIYIELNLAQKIIDLSIGNPKLHNSANPPLSDIEKDILSPSINKIVALLNQVWRNMLSQPGWKLIKTGGIIPDQTINQKSSYITFETSIGIGEQSPSNIIIGYTRESLKKLLDAYLAHADEKTLNLNIFPESIQNKIMVSAQADLGSTRLTTEDIKSLQKGDVICLDLPLDSPIPLTISKKTSFSARLGVQDDKLVVQLISPRTKPKGEILKRKDASIEEEEYFEPTTSEPQPAISLHPQRNEIREEIMEEPAFESQPFEEEEQEEKIAEENPIQEEPEEVLNTTAKEEVTEKIPVVSGEETRDEEFDFSPFEEEESEEAEEKGSGDDFSFPDFLDEEKDK